MTDIYISTGAFKTRSLARILDLCSRYQIAHLELSSGLEFDAGQFDLVRRHKDRFHYLIHNYFPPPDKPFVLNLASCDPSISDRSHGHCQTAIDLCGELGIPFYSVHAGAAIDPRPEDLGRAQTHLKRGSLEMAYNLFIDRIRSLAEHAALHGVRLLIENHVVAPFNLVNGQNAFLIGATAPDLSRIISDVDHPNVGLLIDMGHLKVTACTLRFDPHAFADQIGPHIEAFHLSDNDGRADTNQAFGGNAWFIEMLRGFRNTTLVIEAYQLDGAEIAACRDQLADALSL